MAFRDIIIPKDFNLRRFDGVILIMLLLSVTLPPSVARSAVSTVTATLGSSVGTLGSFPLTSHLGWRLSNPSS